MILIAGVLVLAAAGAAAVVALTTGGSSSDPALGDGVAAIEDPSGGVASFTATAPPGNVAVGEGAIWVLGTSGDGTVSRIDPRTRKVVKTFKPPGLPSELAAGEGALWVGNAGGRGDTNELVSVSRVDPRSLKVTRTVKLPGGGQGVLPTAGLPGLRRAPAQFGRSTPTAASRGSTRGRAGSPPASTPRASP